MNGESKRRNFCSGQPKKRTRTTTTRTLGGVIIHPIQVLILAIVRAANGLRTATLKCLPYGSSET
jgi:uracil phosphoribosyltransferase